MRHFPLVIFCLILLSSCSRGVGRDDRSDVIRTGDSIRSAFSDGDVIEILKYHHADVMKALNYQEDLGDRSIVKRGLEQTLSDYTLTFVSNDIENLYIKGDIAIETTKFLIKGTPKSDGEPFEFGGRTMVVYTRDSNSPTGWSSLREIIQPAY